MNNSYNTSTEELILFSMYQFYKFPFLFGVDFFRNPFYALLPLQVQQKMGLHFTSDHLHFSGNFCFQRHKAIALPLLPVDSEWKDSWQISSHMLSI